MEYINVQEEAEHDLSVQASRRTRPTAQSSPPHLCFLQSDHSLSSLSLLSLIIFKQLYTPVHLLRHGKPLLNPRSNLADAERPEIRPRELIPADEVPPRWFPNRRVGSQTWARLVCRPGSWETVDRKILHLMMMHFRSFRRFSAYQQTRKVPNDLQP